MNHSDEELDVFDFEDYSDDLAALIDEQIAELYFINEQNELPVDPIQLVYQPVSYNHEHD